MYIKGLVESRDIPEPWLLRIKELAEGGLKKGDAGRIIAALKDRPVKPGQDNRSINKPTVQDITPGRYAVRIESQDNDIAFYRVRDTQDKTHRYMVQIVGPTEHLLRVQTANEVAKQIIRAGLGDSAALYGFTIGRCSICHTRITNRLSRELGIGPICGGRVYKDDWDSRVNTARSALQARGLDPTENV